MRSLRQGGGRRMRREGGGDTRGSVFFFRKWARFAEVCVCVCVCSSFFSCVDFSSPALYNALAPMSRT